MTFHLLNEEDGITLCGEVAGLDVDQGVVYKRYLASCIPCIKAYDAAHDRGRTDTTTEVIDSRRGVYGDPRIMFARAAQIWSGILGVEVNAVDVPLMLMGYKILRTQHTPDYSDNSDDIEGYLDIFREIVGEDMIHARSVSQYLALKREQR